MSFRASKQKSRHCFARLSLNFLLGVHLLAWTTGCPEYPLTPDGIDSPGLGIFEFGTSPLSLLVLFLCVLSTGTNHFSPTLRSLAAPDHLDRFAAHILYVWSVLGLGLPPDTATPHL